jgi:hypothetical protein
VSVVLIVRTFRSIGGTQKQGLTTIASLFSKAVRRSTYIMFKINNNCLNYYDPFALKKQSKSSRSSLPIVASKWDSVTHSISYSSETFWRKCNLFRTLLILLLHIYIYFSTSSIVLFFGELRNKSWKPECVESFNMDWRIVVFYPEPEARDAIY